MGQYQRLSPAGAAALSIWALRGEEKDFRALFKERWPQQRDRFTVVAPGGQSSEQAIWDQALCWRRNDADGLVVAELHLHGGYGVADALREWLHGEAWVEKPWSQNTETELLSQQAKTPLALRLALQEERTALAWSALLEEPTEGSNEQVRQRWQQSWQASQWARHAAQPPLVVLLGPANAGKSTLFNRWLRSRRATITALAGTTRDPLESLLLLSQPQAQLAVRLADTAGYAPEASALDQQAWDMSRSLAARAWKVIYVLDAATEPDPVWATMVQARRSQDLLLLNRVDLEPAPDWLQQFGEIDARHHHQDEGALESLEAALLQELGPVPALDVPLSREPAQLAVLAARLADSAPRQGD